MALNTGCYQLQKGQNLIIVEAGLLREVSEAVRTCCFPLAIIPEKLRLALPDSVEWHRSQSSGTGDVSACVP